MNHRSEWLSRCCFLVDFTAYHTRPIRHIYHRPSAELQALIINFAHQPRLTVSHWSGQYANTAVSYVGVTKALDTLLADGHIELQRKGQQGKHSTVYRRTALFEATFRFRKLPKRLVVQRAAPTRESLATDRMHGQDIASIPELQAYSVLVSQVKLSLSNGGQVFEDVVLERGPVGRLYQLGTHGYQNIPKEERPYLLIDGRPTVELDYDSLHFNMRLNGDGWPSVSDFYTTVLRRLGIRKTKARRKAIKKPCLIALNIPTLRGYCCYVGRLPEYQEHLRDLVKPRAIYEAMIALYPQLRPYLCTGKHAPVLQRADSEIMIDVLETLAKMGIVSLPEHDSVICPAEHKDTVKRVMQQVYRRHMGYDIVVK